MQRLWLVIVAFVCVACHNDVRQPVQVRFASASGSLYEYFSKLNVQMFDSTGAKFFSKVKTQNVGEQNFGTLALDITGGTYTLVAVGHSSHNSASIKSPERVEFTANNGEKLTDTFCFFGELAIGADSHDYAFTMERVTAMFRLTMEDASYPSDVTRLLFEYTGGSANFNPSTGQGCTKSSQSENRTFCGLGSYDVYTFPYMSDSCKLKMTITALDGSDQIVKKRVFESVPMIKNHITEYKGRFFGDDDDPFGAVSVTFLVNGTWDGVTTIRF